MAKDSCCLKKCISAECVRSIRRECELCVWCVVNNGLIYKVSGQQKLKRWCRLLHGSLLRKEVGVSQRIWRIMILGPQPGNLRKKCTHQPFLVRRAGLEGFILCGGGKGGRWGRMGCDVGDGSKETAFYRSTLTVSTLPFIWRENVLSPRRRTLNGEGSLLVEKFRFVELRWKWHWHMHKKSPQSAPSSYWSTSLRRFPIPSWDKYPPGGKGATTEELILIHIRWH